MPLYSFPHHAEHSTRFEKNKNRFFIHLDIDAFFAQVEQRDNPKLRGKPVSVGGNGGMKGICMTASYEARAYGVEIGMSVVDAMQLCPDLISVPSYGTKYEAILQNILGNIGKYVPDDCIEQYSIDECFLEITGVVKDWHTATSLAWKIKKMIWDTENLTSSIGLSYNKTYSKIATKFDKPDGLAVVREEDRESKIYGLPVDKMWGIGRRNTIRLNSLGIRTIGELANSHIHIVHKEFGINGVMFRKIARGEDTAGIHLKKERLEKSFNHAHTLTNAIYTEREINSEIKRMVEYICRRMRAKNFIATQLGFFIRYDDLGSLGDSVKLKPPTNDERDLMFYCKEIYNTFPKPTNSRKARQFGITAFDLHQVTGYNLDLFKKFQNMPFKEIDCLKEKYGERIIRVGLDAE
jgi:DNA polymerase-4